MIRRRRLRTRLMLVFAGLTLGVAALFGLYAAVFVYTVEDRFFEAMLEQEATEQVRHFVASGRWAEPRSQFMAVHGDPRLFPADLAAQFQREPWRREFPGSQGRHYHLWALKPPPPAQPAWLVAEVSRQLVVRPMREELFGLLGWSGLLVIGVALLIGYWLARRTAEPLSRLASLVDGMRPGDLPQRFVERYPDDEVGVLAQGLEDLVNRIRAFIAREQEFTRDASHELRTPLTVIRSATERLAAEPALSDAGRRHLAHVRQSAVQLEQTVTILLSLAREEWSRAEVPTAVLPILEHVIVDQSPLLEGKEVAVDVTVPRNTCVTLPAPVLHILLANLVSNAFAHTDAGEVRIGVERGRLRIANSGPGIDPAVRDSLHEPFSKREGSAGFGLGLAIVRRLCDRYDVDLRIECGDGETVASFAVDRAAC